MTIIAALQLLIQLGAQLQGLASLIRTAQSEGRDITDAELDTLVKNDDAARAALDAAIKVAQAGG